MRRVRCTLSLIGAWLGLISCAPAVGCTRPTPLTAAEPRQPSASEETTTSNTDDELEWVNHLAPSTISESGELLVATAARSCTTKQCPGQCCNDCGRVVWKLASDPDAEVVTHGVKLPKLVATECSLHYDLRAVGEKEGKRFVVRAAQPVPSERGRRPGTTTQLEARPNGGSCTLMACSTRCCNSCSGITWVPVPTFDAIKWSGTALLPEGAMDCDLFARVVTGNWLGPNQFEIHAVRALTEPASTRGR